MTHYWVKRLCDHANWNINDERVQDMTTMLKVHQAWFVEGYPKYNLPRIEAEITGLFYNPEGLGSLEIHIKAIRELVKSAQNVDPTKFVIINPIVRREM